MRKNRDEVVEKCDIKIWLMNGIMRLYEVDSITDLITRNEFTKAQHSLSYTVYYIK